ncbi:SDR family NAD(P)-dependent oxidoreductase [uncultured Brevundimonas sp.]|uniref:SDR family NAD(P)-dependent oxidoreductase n=1 Tax=uncultured Brevundimonas sp. TaxID=213418 RepID=UPI002621FF64|nr:SDR family NAD(P)-dependent oxidoreductase [uncultured Brevundimonas sp.]
MRSPPDVYDAPPLVPGFSRRTLLAFTGAGLSAGLVAGCSPGRTGPSGQGSGARSDGGDGAPIPDWTTADIPAQRGRRVLVTGGNGFPAADRSGLGYQDALALARAGAAVTIASRNTIRGEEAVRRIRAEAPGSTVRFERLDLADLASVQAFSARMNAADGGLDLLVNNAGVMGRRDREVSVDGFERVLASNTIGHFALTAQLLPALRRGRDPRIVWVGSSRTSDALPFDDLQLERDYDYAAAYDHSKLANLLLAFETDRRSKAEGWGISSLAAHPGVARTNLIPDGPGLDSPEGFRFRMLPFMFQRAAQGALPTLYASTSPQAAPGAYYGPRDFRGLRGLPGKANPPEAAGDQRAAATLWTALEGLTRVRFRPA